MYIWIVYTCLHDGNPFVCIYMYLYWTLDKFGNQNIVFWVCSGEYRCDTHDDFFGFLLWLVAVLGIVSMHFLVLFVWPVCKVFAKRHQTSPNDITGTCICTDFVN